MNLQIINSDLFEKLSLAVTIIRNTPEGIKPDVFTRLLAKRLFSRFDQSKQIESIIDEHLILRQENILSRILPTCSSTINSSISIMDFNSSVISETNVNIANEHEYCEFAEKVFHLKDMKRQIKTNDVDYLLNTILKWIITTIETKHKTIPIDACLYTIQLIANHLKADSDQPYHIVLDILPMIDKFLDGLLDHITNDSIYFIHQMLISLASSNSCISRVLDKLCDRIQQYCENSEITDPHDCPIDYIDCLFNILHEVIHNRSIFQRRLSQRPVDKLFAFINQLSSLLHGTSNHSHILKLEGQLQAADYKLTETSVQLFQYRTSSSGNDLSQYQQVRHHRTKSTAPTSLKNNSLEYSMSQNSQSQYF